MESEFKYKVNPNQSKYDYMLENSKDHMDNIALTFFDRKITYEEMFESIDIYAKMLYKKGIRKGDLIGICTLNTPESVYLLYALNKIGAIVIGYSPFDKKEVVKKDIKLTMPKMVITTDFSYRKFKSLEKSLDFTTIRYSALDSSNDLKFNTIYSMLQIPQFNYTFDKNRRLEYLLKTNYGDIILPDNTYVDNEVSDIMFTGGSSGIHKGVDLSDAALNYEIEGMKQLYDENFFDKKIYLGQIPMGHMAFGRSILHSALTNRMTYALTLKAMPNDFYNELVRTQANGASGGPPHWTSLIEKVDGKYVPKSNLKPNSLTNLEVTFSGGEQKKESTEKAINDALAYCGSKVKLGDGLGATETWGSNILNTGNYFKEGYLGVPVPGIKVKLIDPKNGEEVQKGEKGLLYLSGPSLMLGYHNNPEETAKVISYDADGTRWLNLGDYLKEFDGYYKYVGRQKRNFVSGCDNIYPETIEELLLNLPEIREAVITAIPDDFLQFIPSYHISLYSDKINFVDFEKRLNNLIKKNVGESALPGKIEYTTEPLVRMMNAKIDLEYYRKKDIQISENEKSLKKVLL